MIIKNLFIILCIGFVLSCKEKTDFVRYYKNGNKYSTFFRKNGVLNGKETFYYTNGKVSRVSNWINGKEQGWSFKYDSVHSKIIEKVYYKDNIEYTRLKYENSKCKYLYLKPYIPIESDTISVTNEDSIPVIFFFEDKNIKIDELIVNSRLIVNNEEKGYITKVYSFKNKTYINFDSKEWFVKGFQLAVYFQIYHLTKENIKYCDSVENVFTKKIVKIIQIFNN